MFRLSKLLEKLEDKSEARFKSWFARNKAKLPMRVPAVIVGWYFYGMFLNSLRLGITSTFHQTGEEIKSIWVLNPFKNWGAVFTGFGIVTTLVIVLIICLITKKGYILSLIHIFMPKIIVTMAILVPVGGFALIGIGGDSLTRWLKAWINWRKHRRMIFYRGEVRL